MDEFDPFERDVKIAAAAAALLLLVAMIAAFCSAACTGALKGSTFSGGPTFVAFDTVVCGAEPVNGHCAQPIAGATVTVDDKPPRIQVSNADGFNLWTVPTSLRDTFVRVDADGYEVKLWGTIHPGDLTKGHNFLVLKRRESNAGQRGWVHVDGIGFRDDHGEAWRKAGFTSFALAARYCNGEDIAPIVDEVIALGANTVRVLGMASILFHLDPREGPAHYDQCARELLAYLNDRRGIRVEWAVLADAQASRLNLSQAEQQAALDADAARISPLKFSELANEWSQNGVQPLAFQRPNAQGVFSRASGGADEWPVSPPWDYITDHPARPADWPRRMNCRDIAGTFHVPCDENEPMGASETDQPGRRSANPDDFAYWGALCGLQAAGCTFHSDAGMYAQPLGPVQKACAKAFFDAMAWVPTEALWWPYQRGDMGSEAGIGNMPILHDDAKALRTFCKGDGAHEWCVAIRPSATWTAVPRDGWRVVNEPRRGLVYLERP